MMLEIYERFQKDGAGLRLAKSANVLITHNVSNN